MSTESTGTTVFLHSDPYITDGARWYAKCSGKAGTQDSTQANGVARVRVRKAGPPGCANQLHAREQLLRLPRAFAPQDHPVPAKPLQP